MLHRQYGVGKEKDAENGNGVGVVVVRKSELYRVHLLGCDAGVCCECVGGNGNHYAIAICN